MQFVNNGPDIPERLLQLHEDGRIVFFCGAGISNRANLPGFSGLVDRIYKDLSVTPNAMQQGAINDGRFDMAISLLEAEIVGGREKVRRSLAKILMPNLIKSNATSTHEALLILSKNRENHLRLATTNFDRVFTEVGVSKSLLFQEFKAPLLPVPKTRWNGLVYLHGLLPLEPTADDLDQLILSSGDFGRAYLTEGWAARFVSELFRNFSVCFIGYSINDPILRYMTDAIAADRLLGEKPLEMFAFGSYSDGREVEFESEWKAKGVTPILYRDDENHTYLHETLLAWADAYRDGVRSKERIVVECAILHPSTSTKQNDFVGRLRWALSDPSGLPAKRFAEFNPVPPLDWLEPFSQQLYGHADLDRFGVSPNIIVDEKLTYSLINRPTPYLLSPRMTIVDDRNRNSRLDARMFQLIRWLIRHLDDPKLLIWLIKHDGQLHDDFVQMIRQRLYELVNLTSLDKTNELNRIRENAPNAIPRPAMRTLWSLVIGGHTKCKTYGYNSSLYIWIDQFKCDGLTTSMRLALRKMLTPLLSLRDSYSSNSNGNDIRDIVKCEVVLAAEDVHNALVQLSDNERWKIALPTLLDDFTALLCDTFDLMRELGDVNNIEDFSSYHQPSISHHPQNKYHDYNSWTALIELTREAWLATAKQSREKARIVAEEWMHMPYPIFKRLAFFAAAQEEIIPPQKALDWLLTDEKRWLWSNETRREVIRLLVTLALQLDGTMMSELEQAILSGPSRNMYRTDISAENWYEIRDRSIWLLLAKIDQAGGVLSKAGRARLNELEKKYSLSLARDERDEFRCWMTSGWGLHPLMKLISLPRTRRGMLNYLLVHPDIEESQPDDWRKRCSENFQATAYALYQLTKQGNWPINRWRDAFQAWTEEKLCGRSWHFMAPVVIKAPNDLLQSLSREVSLWLQTAAKTFEDSDTHFLILVQRILQLDFKDDDYDTDDPVSQAFNHPIGHVTLALLYLWFRQKPDAYQRLQKAIKLMFTELCDIRIAKFKYGRLLLAAHVISLFRADQTWSEQYLLPLFNWNSSQAEALAAWRGFLWSPQMHRSFIEAIKFDFLDTARYYTQLGKYNHQFVRLITFIALDISDIFTTQELVSVIHMLPDDGLRESIQTLKLALDSAGDNRENYWKNRVLPFLKDIWPKSKDKISDIYTESFAHMCIAAGHEFPSAVKEIKNWLKPIQNPDYVIHCLKQSELSVHFPKDALLLLSIIVNNDVVHLPQELRQCLDAIRDADSELNKNNNFINLDALARKFNI